MSLKAVELQVALPRTQDVGKMQEHLNQKPVVQQEQMMLQAEQEVARNRKRAIRKGEGKSVSLQGDRQMGSHNQEQGSHNESTNDDDHHPAPHPFKGHRIDISL
ncbi:hypothetical protein [Rubeoparvulum massiliense]|uniref:hypothetical protein n=1 Tax=Rubeoparvulum massiliense TaxID=1631346 RepID=UPI00065E5A58|nr:hypothetical protein [Rubeoparvulum massiliense]